MNESYAQEDVFSYNQIINMVLGALMAALMAVGAFIAIPIGPVPIVLQNMFVMLAGLLLGPWWGMASVGIYLLAGTLGLPVFSGGGAGLAHFFGPTGGYLISYLPAVFVIGLISRLGVKGKAQTGSPSVAKVAIWSGFAMILGTAIVYALGVSQLKIVTDMSWEKAFTVGMLPFLIGDAAKIVAAVFIAMGARKVLDSYIEE